MCCSRCQVKIQNTKEMCDSYFLFVTNFFFFRTGRPVRCMLDRHEDMVITGGRHPFLCHYSVGFDDCGHFKVFDVSVYNNAGSSRDLSTSVNIVLL